MAVAPVRAVLEAVWQETLRLRPAMARKMRDVFMIGCGKVARPQ